MFRMNVNACIPKEMSKIAKNRQFWQFTDPILNNYILI